MKKKLPESIGRLQEAPPVSKQQEELEDANARAASASWHLDVTRANLAVVQERLNKAEDQIKHMKNVISVMTEVIKLL